MLTSHIGEMTSTANCYMPLKLTHLFKKLQYPSLSSALYKKIQHDFIDKAFYKGLLNIWISIGVGILLYILLLFTKQTWVIHLWVATFILIYLMRLSLYYLYFKSNLLSPKIKKARFSPFLIMLWGTLSGAVWTFLFFILVHGYPIESMVIGILTLILFSTGVQFRYSLIPLWYFSYAIVIVVPISIWLLFQNSAFILFGLGILLYTYYTLRVALSYYQLHFNAIYLQLRNEQLLTNLKTSRQKIQGVNKDLIKNNADLHQEIKRREIVEEKLAQNATHDFLTKLPNRQLLQDRLNQAILSSKRRKNHFAVLYIDLDGFKYLNDKYGHGFGDKFLQAVAKRLKSSLRKEDTVSRIGGDEFVILINNLDKKTDIEPIAQKIIFALSSAYDFGKNELTCPASLGISVFPEDGHTFKVLIRNSDRAMYKAKKEGGARFSTYTSQTNDFPSA